MKLPRKASTLRPLATELLDDCGISDAPVPIEDVAEFLYAEIRYSPFAGELAGILVRNEGNQAVIGVNSAHHPNRQRFTIAHECGHLLLHKGKDVHIDRSFRINRRDQRSAQAVDPIEIEANRFAAELLMPFSMIISDIVEFDIEDDEVLKDLADKYQVSLQALTFRINNLMKAFI